MPEEKLREKQESRIEKIMLLFYFIYSSLITVITMKSDWPAWLAWFTDLSWVICLGLYLLRFRSYQFRAYAMTCLMQMSVVLWSVSSESLSLTIPIFLMLAVALVFYGIPEISYIPIAVFIFLVLYHIVIANSVDFSSNLKIFEAVLEIIAVLFIEYIIYVLNKTRLAGMEKQKEIIDSLKEAERSKDDFMANISHEIRTPINSICGISEIVLREELEDQVRSDVFSIQTAGRSLQSIVSDILDFTEMQSGKMNLVEEVYNITSTINDVINMSMARKTEKQIDLIVDCDANIPSGLMGDEQKIRRVIMNLVNNALKFTMEGCVSINIGARDTEYGINLIISIKDTGIGMKKESMEKLFTSFNQVDTKRNRQREGIGLGLAISQAMVDMMGGFITVSSEFGKGSEIQFVVPQKVTNATPIASVQNPDSVNVAIYVNMEQYDRPDVREAYTRVIFHMMAQLKVKCHVCQNLSELKRRAEREDFTHIFISIEEYEEDRTFFDGLAEKTKVVAVIERFHDTRITNPHIQRLYKPFFILPIVMVLNDERMIQGIDANYYSQGKFIAPGTNVLVVDDNLMNIRVLEGLLKPYEIKVAIATSGAEALEKIESMCYDVVFMDHMMPEMDGVETLQRIRQKQGNYFKKIPIVAVTANAVGGMREVFLKEGFQDFIAKPIEISVLERVLRRVLPQEKLMAIDEDSRKATRKETPATDNEAVEKPQKEKSKASKKKKPESPKEEEKPKKERKTDLPSDDFDEELGLKYCGGLDAYIEILQLVGASGQEEKEKIGQLFEEKDWTKYCTKVHALKSTMISIGVEKLSNMAKALELACKEDKIDFVLENHEEMMSEYERILGLLMESKTLGLKN